MKPVHGDTVSNDGYSSTSCSYRTESGQTHHGSRSNISRLFQEKYIPLRESKLLEKLVKTRVLYEELRNELLSSSISHSSSPALTTAKQHSVIEKDVDEAEKSNIIALVDLVDKGVILRPKKLSECRSYNNCKSRSRCGLIENIQRTIHAREYLTSKSSIISKRKSDEVSRLGIQFKTKNIKSDPCTCTLKYRDILTRKSKEMLKKVRLEDNKKVNRQNTKEVYLKLKRFKSDNIERKLHLNTKSIHSFEEKNKKTGSNVLASINARYVTNPKYSYSPNKHKMLSTGSSDIGTVIQENGQEIKHTYNDKYIDNLKNPCKNLAFSDEGGMTWEYCKKRKNIKNDNMLTAINNETKRQNIPDTKNDTLDDTIVRSKFPTNTNRYIIGLGQNKSSKGKLIPRNITSKSMTRSSTHRHILKRCFENVHQNTMKNAQKHLKCPELTNMSTFRECIPDNCNNKIKNRKKQYVNPPHKDTLVSNKISKLLHTTNISSKIPIHSAKQILLPHMNLTYKKNKSPFAKNAGKTYYVLPKHKLYRRRNSLNLSTANIFTNYAKPATNTKEIFTSQDRIAVVPKTYCWQKNMFNGISIKKYVKRYVKCNKTQSDSCKAKLTTTYISRSTKTKPKLLSSVNYKSDVLIYSSKQNNNYENLLTKQKLGDDSKYAYKSVLTKLEKSQSKRNRFASTPMQTHNVTGWMISPVLHNCFYALQLHKYNKSYVKMHSPGTDTVLNKVAQKNTVTKKLSKQKTYFQRNCQRTAGALEGFRLQKRSEKIKQKKTIFTKKPQKLLVQENSPVKSNTIREIDRKRKARLPHTNCTQNEKNCVECYNLTKFAKQIETHASHLKSKKYASSLKLVQNSEKPKRNSECLSYKPNNLNLSLTNKEKPDHLKRLYFDDKSLPSIISISTIAFKTKKSIIHKSQVNIFSSADFSFNITSKEIVEIKSKFSCEVNISRHILPKRRRKATKSNKMPLVLGRCEERRLGNNGSIVRSSQIRKPIQVNQQLTGMSALLKRCFCTMNIQVANRGAPKKNSYKLNDNDCEPGVCVPYECNPYECQKLLMKRLLRQVSEMPGSKHKSRANSSLTSRFKPNLKTKNKIDCRCKPAEIKPRELPIQTQYNKQTKKIASSFSLNVEFSKNNSKAAVAKENKNMRKTHSTSAQYKSTAKRLKDKDGTQRSANKRHKQSHSDMRKVYHRRSSVSPMLKRCFCTLKLQKKGKQQIVRDFHSNNISTPTKSNVQEKHRPTELKHKKSVLIPCECDPYKGLELIKKRKQRSRGTASVPSKLSSGMPSLTKKRAQRRHSHSKRTDAKSVRSKEIVVKTKSPVISTDELSTSPAREAVKLGSSKNIKFYKETKRTNTPSNVAEKKPVKENPQEQVTHVKKRDRKEKKSKIVRKPKKVVSDHTDVRKKKTQNVSPNSVICACSKHFQVEKVQPEQSKISMMNAIIKRCFCTAKLQGKEKDNKGKPATTQTRRLKHNLDLCECVPEFSDPYEGVKLTKKRNPKDKGSSTERQTKSVSSSFASSKTSKAGVAQSRLQATALPVGKDKRLHEFQYSQDTAPSESVIIREESSEDSTTRQAVRIGSSFSFDIEFYKDSQFPSYHRIQAAGEAIRSIKRKMREVRSSENTKIDTISLPSRSSQMYEAAKVDKAFGSMLKCLCTPKLQGNQKRRRQSKPIKQYKTRVKPSKHQRTGTTFSRPVPDLHDRSVMTAYKLKTYPYKLEPYECESGVCIPGECDPYECLERIKRRNMNRGSSTDNVKTKSTVNMTKMRHRHRDSRTQHAVKEKKRVRVRNVPSTVEPRIESRSIVSSPSGSKQVVRIGSNFSFDVEFYKDRSHSGSTCSPKQPPKRVTYEKPRREKVKDTVSRTTQGITVTKRKRKTQRTEPIRDNESQMVGQKMRSTMTGVAPFIKRCFCTLQLQKRGQKEPKPRKPDLDSFSVGTETIKFKPEIYSEHKGTQAKKKYKFQGRTLEPYECEPGVCIPGECDPYECLERIKKRGMHSKRSSTGRNRSRTISTSAGDYKKPKREKTQVYAPKEKRVKTKHTYDRVPVKEHVICDTSPCEPSQRQAVRIGSSFSFNIEFYKDQTRQVCGVCPESQVCSKVCPDPVKCKKIPLKQTGSGTSKRSRSVSSSYRRVRLRGQEIQTKPETRSQASGAGLLKRCFCTLKLQKIGKDQILPNVQIQTSPTAIEQTYKHTGTKIKKHREPRQIAGRERGTRTRKDALLPYECEPGVCIPGECDPYECLERIKMRNRRHSGTGMTEPQTRSMTSFTPKAKKIKSMNTQMRPVTRRRSRTTESRYKVRQPPRPSRALENININQRQAVRLGSDFGFNIEFYKDRSRGPPICRNIPECAPSKCNTPECTQSKCKTSSCPSKCSYKNQGTRDSISHHNRRLQAKHATASRASSVRRLKRCFCTLTLQRAEVKTVMNSLRTTTSKVKKQDKSTCTKNKYFCSLLPYECEPGVCIPGECDPYECLERIKRRNGPYGPCDCLEKKKARIRRVSRTTETGVKRTRALSARSFTSGMKFKRMQLEEPTEINNVVEEPRFKRFINNPYTKNSVKLSSNFSFNIEFTRDISFPSSTLDSDERSIDSPNFMANTSKVKCIEQGSKADTSKVKITRETQKPDGLRNEMTATELFKRCFCTKQLWQLDERDNIRDKTHEPFLRRCFCTKKLITPEVSHPAPDERKSQKSEKNILSKCLCKAPMKCLCPKCLCKTPIKCFCQPKKRKIKCLCASKNKDFKCLCSSKKKNIKCLCSSKNITIARLEIERLNPKLINNKEHDIEAVTFTDKTVRKKMLPEQIGIFPKSSCSEKLIKRKSGHDKNYPHKQPARRLLSLGTQEILKIKPQQSDTKLGRYDVERKSPVREKSLMLKDESISVELFEREISRAASLLPSKTRQRKISDSSRTSLSYVTESKQKSGTLLQLFSSNVIGRKSDQGDSTAATATRKLPDKIQPSTASLNSNTEHHGSRPNVLFKSNEYWVQYQIKRQQLQKRCLSPKAQYKSVKQQHYLNNATNNTGTKCKPIFQSYDQGVKLMIRSDMEKACHGRHKKISDSVDKPSPVTVTSSSKSLETILSYSPTKFHNANSKSKMAKSEVRFVSLCNRMPLQKCYHDIGSNNTCYTVSREFNAMKYCVNEDVNKHINEDNIICCNGDRLITENNICVRNTPTKTRHSYSEIKKSICKCFRQLKLKKQVSEKYLYSRSQNKKIQSDKCSCSKVQCRNVKLQHNSTNVTNKGVKPNQISNANYQDVNGIKRSKLRKTCNNRPKQLNARVYNKPDQMTVTSSSAIPQTIMSNSLNKHHKSNSYSKQAYIVERLGTSNCKSSQKYEHDKDYNDTRSTVPHIFNLEQDNLNKDNKENVIYSSERLIIEKSTITIPNNQSKTRHSHSDIKKSICNCFRKLKLKKYAHDSSYPKVQNKKIQSDKYPNSSNKNVIQKDNLTNTTNDRNPNSQCVIAQKTLSNKPVQCEIKYNLLQDKTNKDTYCNTKSSRCPTVNYHDKITYCNNENSPCTTINFHDKVKCCKSENTQCPTVDIRNNISYCASQNSQGPADSNHDKIFNKSHNTPCARRDKLTICNSRHFQSPSARVHDKQTDCNFKNTGCVPPFINNRIANCKSQNVQCTSETFKKKVSCCKIQNTESHVHKQKSCNTMHSKSKCNLTKNIMKPLVLNGQSISKKKTKLIKVVGVSSDFKHLICSNNTIYKIKDIVPPGASGDYKFAFVLESKGFKNDYKAFFPKKDKQHEKCLIDHNMPCTCIVYKNKGKRTQKQSICDNKMSCPCLTCRKTKLPLKYSSDQEMSCHMMEVRKVYNPKKLGLSHKKNGRRHIKAFRRNGYPIMRTMPCKCGNKICATETKKVAKEERMKFKRHMFTKRTCTCGSAICAAKHKKAIHKVLRPEIKKQKQKEKRYLKQYKKEQNERLKRYNKIKELEKMKLMKEIKASSDVVLVMQSLIDLNSLAIETTNRIVRGGYRAIKNPKYTGLFVKNMILHPKVTLAEMRKSGKDNYIINTFRRIGMRLGALTLIQKIRILLESQPALNRFINKNNRILRRHPRPLEMPDECRHLYASSLREKPCFWVHYLWPWFYPHCINGLRMFKQLTDVILFMSAIVVWSPCLFATELCRALLYCILCTG